MTHLTVTYDADLGVHVASIPAQPFAPAPAVPVPAKSPRLA